MKRMSRSQVNTLTGMLEDDSPCRADVELLEDGNLLVALYRYALDGHHQERWLVRLVGRRGQTVREAKRGALMWDEYTMPNGEHPPHVTFGGPQDDDIIRFVKGTWWRS